MGITSKHQIAEVVQSGGQVEPGDFHAQWHIKVSLICFFFLFLGWGLGVVGQKKAGMRGVWELLGSCKVNYIFMVKYLLGVAGSC